jgi:DNA-binding transcriptional regulator YiaG
MPLDRSQFVAWLEARRQRESLAAIGEDLGVSQVAVTLWLQGKRRPSRMALRLGALLAPRDAARWPMD